jgi:N-acetylmuramic acid 6-phosphate etherase
MTPTSMAEDKKRSSLKIFMILSLFFLTILVIPWALQVSSQEESQVPQHEENLLQLLGISPSAESVDYLQNKTQFQLHTLLTEQRHPKTWNLSYRTQKDSESGLEMLFSVDEDIEERVETLDLKNLEQLVKALEEALLEKKKIYIYGCGATGRLAKQMESTFWRPFWQKAKERKRVWSKIESHLGEGIEEKLIGEMTGGDRALISSLEGFEDLQLIGRLQLEDRKIERGDVVICVTEGGETSSVIGTILAALRQWKEGSAFNPSQSKNRLYFVYNNPDEKLIPFDRSREVLEEEGITKINLTTGPQAITGSTRMQATTIETFVIGNALQTALERTLRRFLSKREMRKLGFRSSFSLEEKLREFSSILKEVKKNIGPIAKFTDLESQTYSQEHLSAYFAQKGLITVFIDSTERSPTFRLYPLDTVKEPRRKCWIQVWTPAADLQEAWLAFLGRPFRGLSPEFYREPFEEEIDDPYLKRAALESLKSAGNDQQFLHDFSFSEFNLKNRGPEEGDLGVLICLTPEEKQFREDGASFIKFIDLFLGKGARVSLIFVTDKSPKKISKLLSKQTDFSEKVKDTLIVLEIKDKNDPFSLNQQIALKILLNAHSTAVMARLGKVIGNTMTNVSPSNLKLIGRATYLIQSHVNDVLSRPQWVKLHGIRKPISYGEANAVLFEAIDFLKNRKVGQTAEVALSIIRILESLRRKESISLQEALRIVQETGLSQYLSTVTSEQKE